MSARVRPVLWRATVIAMIVVVAVAVNIKATAAAVPAPVRARVAVVPVDLAGVTTPVQDPGRVAAINVRIPVPVYAH